MKQAVDKKINLFWRILFVLAAAILIWLFVQSTVSALFGSDYNRTAHIIRAIGIFGLAVPMVVVARKWLDGNSSLSEIGLAPARQGMRPFAYGIAAWLLPAIIGAILCFALGWASITTAAAPFDIALNFLSLLALVFLFEAVPEELIFRGYIYYHLAAKMPTWAAVGGQAVLFTILGSLGNGIFTPDRLIFFLIFGIIAGIMRAITGSVWTTIGFHLAFQTVMQFFSPIGGQLILQPDATLLMLGFVAFPFVFGPLFLRWVYKKQRKTAKTAPATS